MNILLTNIELSNYAGTQKNVRDIAVSLKKRGHSVEIYSPYLGEISTEISQKGINVTDDPATLKLTPDLIHAHHYIPTMEVISLYPDVPVIYFLHDRTHIIDVPPQISTIVHYVAVDYNCLDRLLTDLRIPESSTDVLLNYVDIDCFRLRNTFSEKPLKALVFSNYANHKNYFATIKQACKNTGIELDGIGAGLEIFQKNPELILHNYDIVFAKAKAAIEALATGASVILCDFRGLGGMVNPTNFEYLRKFNFGMRTLTENIQVDLLENEIRKYNPHLSKETANLIRKEANLSNYIDQLEKKYKEVLHKFHAGEYLLNRQEDERIISEYLSIKTLAVNNDHLNPYKKENNRLRLELKKMQLKSEDSGKNLWKQKEKAIHNESVINDLLKQTENYRSRIEEMTENENRLGRDVALLIKENVEIRKSVSFRLGFLLTFPFRIIVNRFNLKKHRKLTH